MAQNEYMKTLNLLLKTFFSIHDFSYEKASEMLYL